MDSSARVPVGMNSAEDREEFSWIPSGAVIDDGLSVVSRSLQHAQNKRNHRVEVPGDVLLWGSGPLGGRVEAGRQLQPHRLPPSSPRKLQSLLRSHPLDMYQYANTDT